MWCKSRFYSIDYCQYCQFALISAAAVGMLQPFKLIARGTHLKIGTIKEMQNPEKEDDIYDLVGPYHAHSSLDAGEEEKCHKEEEENDCKRHRYCVEIILKEIRL